MAAVARLPRHGSGGSAAGQQCCDAASGASGAASPTAVHAAASWLGAAAARGPPAPLPALPLPPLPRAPASPAQPAAAPAPAQPAAALQDATAAAFQDALAGPQELPSPVLPDAVLLQFEKKLEADLTSVGGFWQDSFCQPARNTELRSATHCVRAVTAPTPNPTPQALPKHRGRSSRPQPGAPAPGASPPLTTQPPGPPPPAPPPSQKNRPDADRGDGRGDLLAWCVEPAGPLCGRQRAGGPRLHRGGPHARAVAAPQRRQGRDLLLAALRPACRPGRRPPGCRIARGGSWRPRARGRGPRACGLRPRPTARGSFSFCCGGPSPRPRRCTLTAPPPPQKTLGGASLVALRRPPPWRRIQGRQSLQPAAHHIPVHGWAPPSARARTRPRAPRALPATPPCAALRQSPYPLDAPCTCAGTTNELAIACAKHWPSAAPRASSYVELKPCTTPRLSHPPPAGHPRAPKARRHRTV